jgi:NAD(P)-dependent dehydrogenase (short-subunit alcohol dehydrogenase family)
MLVRAAFGRIGICVSNAGAYPMVPVEEATYAEWRRMQPAGQVGALDPGGRGQAFPHVRATALRHPDGPQRLGIKQFVLDHEMRHGPPPSARCHRRRSYCRGIAHHQ